MLLDANTSHWLSPQVGDCDLPGRIPTALLIVVLSVTGSVKWGRKLETRVGGKRHKPTTRVRTPAAG